MSEPGIQVKICGLTKPQDMEAVAAAGASYAGLNFFPKSPRYVSGALAREISLAAPVGLARVGLFVNADDAQLDAVLAEVPLDFLQLHGAETPERIEEIRARYGLPLIKAVGVADAEDVSKLSDYARHADMLLVDAKPPKNAELPGGNGLTFDWRLIAGRRWSVPWMLAGGLTPDNVAEAVKLTGARMVDVASGVESAPGVKDPEMIARFTAAAQG
ncbi:phosphoribosylanthranilate isomerase [Pararhodobacter oceanensis]|uniref:N-(5'-phosphoribosyl)anthranilate isomerase n=1 Tax=Pararhodobacter oceanensis TaxID=2172121 RepID=A0A2T8HWD2_9RHOB|nr:phosphoribosylanthranilate isomerase [Pararhodobacter oceanensis]PVH29708.1 phosphoribosylanthranilate isomerase [Pararhodobacter oceanensis]